MNITVNTIFMLFLKSCFQNTGMEKSEVERKMFLFVVMFNKL